MPIAGQQHDWEIQLAPGRSFLDTNDTMGDVYFDILRKTGNMEHW